jgi:cytochrome c553
MTSTRAAAKQMAEALEPLIAGALDEYRQRLRPVTVPATNVGLLAAARAVAEAVDWLEASRFTSGERAARVALERGARGLRSVMRRSK